MDTNQWLQVAFVEPKTVYGVVVKGNSISSSYVSSYYVMYSWDGVSYSYVENSQGQIQVQSYFNYFPDISLQIRFFSCLKAQLMLQVQ